MRAKVFFGLTAITALIAGYQLNKITPVDDLAEIVDQLIIDPLIPDAVAAIPQHQLLAVGPVRFEPMISDLPISSQYQVQFQERECLREAIYFESRGESLAGRLAVGLVIMNRMNRSDFPHTICGVVHEGPRTRKGIPIKNKCQFSYYCDGLPDIPKDKEAWLQALQDAQVILDGRVFDFTAGATHYHADYVKTNWGYPKVAQIDNHIFYKRK